MHLGQTYLGKVHKLESLLHSCTPVPVYSAQSTTPHASSTTSKPANQQGHDYHYFSGNSSLTLGAFSARNLLCNLANRISSSSSHSLSSFSSLSLALPSANGIPVPFSFPYVLSLPPAFSTTEMWESGCCVWYGPSARTGSSQVTRFSIAPTPSLLKTGQKVPDHTTCPASQRSYLHWGHPASYFFMGDPLAFPGPFSFLVGGTSVLTRFISSLQSPSAIHQMPELATSRAVWLQRPWVASIDCQTVAGPIHTILASPAHQPISARCPVSGSAPGLSFSSLPCQPPPPGFIPTPPLILSQSRSLV
ncbi:unnamed protein product [Acanthosepion pharaonis]|uniref:Uncharacterized protein n=1 Tax=Acanthosepion pharaonis TaxID=158019 RepID=A0A812CR79_ACAPH|nr:unnamed protein product [Sepia pharaonis]